MTKVTILGNSKVEEFKKKIEFIRFLEEDGTLTPSQAEPEDWDNILLLSKNYRGGEDLMFAYHEGGEGTLYLGHFNDGVV